MDEHEPDAATSAAATTAPSPGPGTQGRGLQQGASDAQAPVTLNQVRYPCLMNMDYHATREAWLDQWHRWLMFTVIAAGAAAFVDMWPQMKVWGPIIAVVAGALDLTFDLSNRARAHAMFRRRYSEIVSEATREPDKLQVLQCKLDELSGEEEPAYHAQLALSAMKAQQQVFGSVKDPCRPGRIYRLLANVWRFDGHDFNEDKA